MPEDDVVITLNTTAAAHKLTIPATDKKAGAAYKVYKVTATTKDGKTTYAKGAEITGFADGVKADALATDELFIVVVDKDTTNFNVSDYTVEGAEAVKDAVVTEKVKDANNKDVDVSYQVYKVGAKDDVVVKADAPVLKTNKYNVTAMTNAADGGTIQAEILTPNANLTGDRPTGEAATGDVIKVSEKSAQAKYELKTVRVYKADGKTLLATSVVSEQTDKDKKVAETVTPVAATETVPAHYTFVMPAEEVVIKAEFDYKLYKLTGTVDEHITAIALRPEGAADDKTDIKGVIDTAAAVDGKKNVTFNATTKDKDAAYADYTEAQLKHGITYTVIPTYDTATYAYDAPKTVAITEDTTNFAATLLTKKVVTITTGDMSATNVTVTTDGAVVNSGVTKVAKGAVLTVTAKSVSGYTYKTPSVKITDTKTGDVIVAQTHLKESGTSTDYVGDFTLSEDAEEDGYTVTVQYYAEPIDSTVTIAAASGNTVVAQLAAGEDKNVKASDVQDGVTGTMSSTTFTFSAGGTLHYATGLAALNDGYYAAYTVTANQKKPAVIDDDTVVLTIGTAEYKPAQVWDGSGNPVAIGVIAPVGDNVTASSTVKVVADWDGVDNDEGETYNEGEFTVGGFQNLIASTKTVLTTSGTVNGKTSPVIVIK